MELINENPEIEICTRAPGVYFEEITLPREREIRTGIPLIAGFSEWLDDSSGVTYRLSPDSDKESNVQVLKLSSWEGARNRIGAVDNEGFLDYAVRGFFENGGRKCIVLLLRGFGTGSAKKKALKRLLEEDGLLERIQEAVEADLVCVPDIMREEILKSPESVRELQQYVLDYCRRTGDRFAILDCGDTCGSDVHHTVDTGTHWQNKIRNVLDWQNKLSDRALLKNGAAYFPWAQVKHRHHKRDNVMVPPCGHIAGIYASSDERFGVHKAPANEIVEGVVDLEIRLADEEQTELNKVGINCLRSFPGRGIRVWGARTLSGQPNWRYVNVRRLFLTLVRWCENNFDDLLFEGNEPRLWNQVSGRLGVYCFTLFQKGALKGSSVDEAFYIKCDGETNPPEIRETGRMICEVGLAPVTPAEFVVVRITCSVAGITATI